MDLKLEIAQPWVVVHLSGRIDSFNYDGITAKIQTLIRMGKSHLAIDLNAVTYLGLPSLRFFYSTAGRLEHLKGGLALITSDPKLLKSIAIVNQPTRMLVAPDLTSLPPRPELARMNP